MSIPLVCTDTEGRASNSPDIVTRPAHGDLGGINNDQVIYTPNANFQGHDSFTFKSDDGNSDSNSQRSLDHRRRPRWRQWRRWGWWRRRPHADVRGGKTATIVGTAGSDALSGRPATMYSPARQGATGFAAAAAATSSAPVRAPTR